MSKVEVVRYREFKWQVRLIGADSTVVFPEENGFFVKEIAYQCASKWAHFMGVEQVGFDDEFEALVGTAVEAEKLECAK